MNPKNALRGLLLAVLLGSALVLFGARQNQTAIAAPNVTFTVTKTADTNDGICDSDCSLREAISAANLLPGADIITVPAGTYTLTIAGTGEDANATGDLDILGDVTINGAGASTTIIQADTIGYPSGSANGIDRVMHVTGAYTVNISGVTIANGKTTGDGGIWQSNGGILTVVNNVFLGNSVSGSGGGIENFSGTLTVTNSSFVSNSANNGGAIQNLGGATTVANSTISGSTALTNGGAIINPSGTVRLINNTISGNTATSGGGIYNSALLIYLNNIVANSTSGGDCVNTNTIFTNTNNLVEDAGCSASLSGDPALGALGYNGGPTQTFAITHNSPAYNAGDNTTCAAAPVSNKDQRGVTRPQAPTCDIGAYEGVSFLAVNTTTDENDHFCNDGDCAIHDAIENIMPGGSVDFDSSLAGATIHLGSVLTIDKNMTVDGSHLTSSIILSGDTDSNGSGDVQVFHITNAVTFVGMEHLTITKGAATTGGGIYNAGTLLLTGSTISNNTASSYGGAIDNDNATLTVANSAFSGNTANTDVSPPNNVFSGGIHSNGTLTVLNSTFSGNSMGILSGGGNTLNLSNTIIANSTNYDCLQFGALGTEKNNLIEGTGQGACGFVNGTNGDVIGNDPNLGSLVNNGGITQTFALLAGSPAIDAGDNTTCAASPVKNKDQRGATRPLDGDGNSSAVCDIGSYEAPQGNTPTPTHTPTNTPIHTFTPTYTPTRTITPTSTTTNTPTATACIGIPGKPTLLSPANGATVTAKKVPLDWTDAACATSYKVIVKNTVTGAKTIINVSVSNATTPALPSGKYKWFVTAKNGVGSTKSDKFTFTR